jgi:hypothetical protein
MSLLFPRYFSPKKIAGPVQTYLLWYSLDIYDHCVPKMKHVLNFALISHIMLNYVLASHLLLNFALRSHLILNIALRSHIMLNFTLRFHFIDKFRVDISLIFKLLHNDLRSHICTLSLHSDSGAIRARRE